MQLRQVFRDLTKGTVTADLVNGPASEHRVKVARSGRTTHNTVLNKEGDTKAGECEASKRNKKRDRPKP